MKDYYNILGVRKDASVEEIRQAYRTLAVKYHPDKNNGQRFIETFKDINEAKQVLLNEERKREYDSLFVEEGSGRFFNRLKGVPVRIKEMRGNSNKPHFIKRSTNKKIVLLASLSILFAVAVIFFSRTERNEPVPQLTIYPQTNEVNKNEVNKNAIAAAETPAAKADNKIGTSESEEYPSIKLVPEPVTAEVKAVTKPEKAADNNIEPPEGKKEIKTVIAASPPKVANKKVLVKPEIKGIEKQLTAKDMNGILRSINIEKLKQNSNSRCVQIRKTVNSNVENAFKLAEFLSRSGYIISGRETVSGNVQKVKIDAADGCIKVTVGTF